MTKYLILKKNGTAWEQVAEAETVSARAAIQAAVAKQSDSNGSYVAIPARSWKPVKVEVAQALKFS
jgi:hypothetical protein